MKHFHKKENIGLLATKLNRQKSLSYFWITKLITERHILDSAGDSTSVFPLYLYPEDEGQQKLDGTPERTPNLDSEMVQKIADGLGLKFVPESDYAEAQSDRPTPSERQSFAPIDLLDYIYAVLHSPTYREKYKEFLKIDFPRVPYPTEPETFWQLVELGGEMRQIHLLEHPIVDDFITTYPQPDSNEITKRLTKTQPGFIPYEEDDDAPTHTGEDHRYPNERLGKILINKEQYFGNVPEKAWNFYIGGYQPAEKWLKDRRDRELSVDEIQHYQKIIVALMETDRIMQRIDAIDVEKD